MEEGQRRNRKKKNKGEEMWAIGLATTFFLTGVEERMRQGISSSAAFRLGIGDCTCHHLILS